MNSQRELTEQIEKAWPAERRRPFKSVVAVSGGADSVSLFHLLAQNEIDSGELIVAHFNHQWRGAESDGDQEFVRQLAKSYGVPFELGQAGESGPISKTDSKSKLNSNSSGESREGVARRERYNFLVQVAGKHQARHIVTAHTRDDQIETLLFRFLRGTGIRGLSGIPAFSSLDHISLVRPMLDVSRIQIEKYLAENSLEYRTDSSNQDESFSRNKIRNELIPLLESEYRFNPESLIGLSHQASQTSQWIDSQLENSIESAVQLGDGQAVIDLQLASTQSLPLLRELYVKIWKTFDWPRRDMSFEKWNLLAQSTIDRTSEIQTMPGNIRFENDGKQVRLRRTN